MSTSLLRPQGGEGLPLLTLCDTIEDYLLQLFLHIFNGLASIYNLHQASGKRKEQQGGHKNKRKGLACNSTPFANRNRKKREVMPLCQTDSCDKQWVPELLISGGKAIETANYLPGDIMNNFVTFSNFLLKLQLFISLTSIPSSFCCFLIYIEYVGSKN